MTHTAQPVALTRFTRRLGQAQALYLAGVRGGREGAAVAVAAAVELILANDAWARRGLHLPLAQLMRALDDLDDGKVGAMLQPTVFAARSPDAGAVQALRAVAALTLDQLVALGFPVAAAAAEVARTLTRAGVPVGRGAAAGGATVMSWRWRLRRGRAKGVERDVYAALADHAAGRGGREPATAKRRYLASLRELARDLRPREITAPHKWKRR